MQLRTALWNASRISLYYFSVTPIERNPETDIKSALAAIDTTLPGEPVEFTRAIGVVGRTGWL